MSQHDFAVDNGPGLSVRTDLQAALQALASQNSGSVEPSVMYAGMVWFDTSSGMVKMRNAANSAWVDLCTMIGTLPIANGGTGATNAADALSNLNVTPWVAYTPTFVGFGTAASVSMWSRRIGDTLYMRGRFTAGTPTATEARITMGFNGTNGGLTSDSTKVPSIQLAGYMATSNVGAAGSYTALIESGITYLTFGIKSASTHALSKANGNSLVGVGEVVSLTAEVPISGW